MPHVVLLVLRVPGSFPNEVYGGKVPVLLAGLCAPNMSACWLAGAGEEPMT